MWFVKVSGGFWAWFQQTLGSRQIIWMILLRVFFDFEVEVLEDFEIWFLRSFFTSESWSLSSPSSALLKCLRKASIYRSLGVGKRHVAESDRWHMSQPNWSAYVIAYTCEATCVIAYTCADAWLVFAWHLANFRWLLSSDSKI